MYPDLFQFKGITVHSYGLTVAIAVMAAWGLSRFIASRQELDTDLAGDFIFVFFVSGIIGARLLFVTEHWQNYSAQPLKILMLQEGGLSWYGSFLSGSLGGVVWARYHRLSVLRWADFYVPIITLGHAIGRMGCYLNGCCTANSDYHLELPIQLLELFLLIILCGVLFLFGALPVQKKKVGHVSFFSKKTGEALVLYCLTYGVIRYWLEFYRQDRTMIGVLSVAQWFSLILVLLGVIVFAFTRFQRTES